MPSVIFIALFAHACRMSEALKEADEHIELPGNNGRYMQIYYTIQSEAYLHN